ncbi:MAG: nicotinamide mononucleotide transporter [Acinetobacter sp.]|nr:nicotinamide mononucleotide transporter [Acinetobacter sp.]
MSVIEIIAVIISIIGVTLTIKRQMWCWFFNFIAFVLYAYIFYEYKLYGETILQFIFIVLNLYGFYHWRKGKVEEHTIRIEKSHAPTLVMQMVLASIAGLLFGLGLHYFTDASLPILDAQLAAFSLLATYWTTQKYIATWVLWVIVDIVYVGMFLYKSLYLTAGLYAVFIGLAILGWKQWNAVKKQQQHVGMI